MGQARRFARLTLEEWGADDLVDTASLIVSELVTNAVVHTGTTARLTLGLQGPALRIEVEDRHPGRVLPIANLLPADTSEHGRGLVITTSLASEWGVEYTSATKRVWALCKRDGSSPTAASQVDVMVSTDGVHVAVVLISSAGDVTVWNDDATALFGWAGAEVVGRPFSDVVVPTAEHSPPDLEVTQPGTGQWQGTYAVICKDGTSTTVFASHTRGNAGKGTVALLVAGEERALLEHPALSPHVPHSEPAPLGLRDDALVRLSVGEYLALAAERVRDPVSADATYVLLSRDFDDELEVVAVSGLPETLLGSRLVPGSPGTPDRHDPRLPVVVPDLAEFEVPMLAGTELRSLVVVPMIVEGRLVGSLAAASARVDGFAVDRAAQLQRFADEIALAADRGRLQAAERERRGWLSFLADSGDLLAGSLDQDMTMAITGQVVVPRIARWCAIHLADMRGRPVLQQVWHEDENQVERLRTAVEAVTPDELEGGNATVLGAPVTSIPLLARRRQIGYLTIDRVREDLVRSEFFLVAESIARRAALAIDNARAHGELQSVGRALQEGLLPPTVPTAPGLDIGVVYEPAGGATQVGGDFYDLFPIGNGTWCFVIGDVCGTGAEAAAVTGLARHTIQALARAGFPVSATLERLNDAILDEGPRSRFLTLVCGTLRLEGGRVLLEMVNAGHPPPFLVDRGGGVREIGTSQTLLGVVDRVSYATETLVLGRGDLLVAVTDGVLERRDGQRMLGAEGLADELKRAAELPAQAVAERVRRLVAEFTEAPQHDDLAVLAIRMEMGAGTTGARPSAEA